MKFNRNNFRLTYFILALAACTVALALILGQHPEWLGTPYDTLSIIVFVVVGVVGFFAAFREAFIPDQPPQPTPRQPKTLNPLHNIQKPPDDFTGREKELETLLKAVRGGGATISSLQGMGGIGKTALALVLANRLKAEYPDAGIYLDLGGSDREKALSPEDMLSFIIRKFVPEADLPDDLASLEAIYAELVTGKRCLFLMDNALDANQVAPAIPPAGSILITTSRQHFTLGGLEPIQLDRLLFKDAIKLLKLQFKKVTNAQAREIVELCDRLPLAILLAGSVLKNREKQLDTASFIDRLKGERIKILDSGITPDERAKASITATLQLSYNLIGTELQASWRKLAIFPDTFAAHAAGAV